MGGREGGKERERERGREREIHMCVYVPTRANDIIHRYDDACMTMHNA